MTEPHVAEMLDNLNMTLKDLLARVEKLESITSKGVETEQTSKARTKKA